MSRIDWRDGLNLERDCSYILREQEEVGVYFHTEKAYEFIKELDNLKAEQEFIIRPFLGLFVEPLETKKDGEYSYVKKVFLKNGDYTSSVFNHYPDSFMDVEAPFSRVLISEPSISQREKVINQLLKLGWKPTIFTEKGQPKLTSSGEPVETLESVGDFGKALSLWYIYNHRQSQIKGFIDNVRDDHRIPSSVNSCATNTFRCAHRIVANIPRVTSVYGKEMRSLFGVKDGRRFVGADLSGLELRMLCHHMNDADYTAQVLTGDIHTYNMEKAGLDNRNQAKTFIYGFLK